MKISYNWIKEYIDLKKSPEGLAEILTNSGSEAKNIEKVDGDCVMDIEITPNRSDCLSYIGLAREISSLTGKPVKTPLLAVKEKTGKAPFSVEIKDRDLCPRYTARLIRGVKIAESPEWLKKRIAAMGLRPVNNVVDITNYVLFELGQPMHAFDYDKIKGHAVLIRRARPGEKIRSIDNVTRPLEKDMLVIADPERPIAIGGVMGGLDTEVAEGAKNILLESAYFNPVSVRRTSFKLALASESSYRFERGVDPAMVLPASNRAALLIARISGGEIGELVDEGKKTDGERNVTLRIERLNKILNLELKEAYVRRVLNSLSLKISSSKKGVIKVLVPSRRQDIRYEIDLIEEIARIYGYEKIDMTIPRMIPAHERKALSWRAKEKIKGVLTSLGLDEVITYGLTAKEAAVGRPFFEDFTRPIAIKNPLSAEQEIMRASLLPGVLNVLRYNVNRGLKDIKIFEIGAVYYSGSDGRHRERTSLCIALTGQFSDDWQREKSNVTLFDLKGMLKRLFHELGLKDFTMAQKADALMASSLSSAVLYEGKSIGIAGCLVDSVRDAFDLSQKVFLAEIDIDVILGFIDLEKKFSEIPKYPSVKRDISLVAGKDVSFEMISSIVKKHASQLVEKIELTDRYTGRQIPEGHQGLLLRIEYRDRKKTLTAEEVDRLHAAIRGHLVEKLGVQLR